MRLGYFLPLSEGGVLAELAEHDLTEGSDAATVVLEIFLLVTGYGCYGTTLSGNVKMRNEIYDGG